jgi:nucleoside phosphorylase
MRMQTDVLLVTVNKYETKALLRAFERATGTQARVVPIENRFYRDLGTVNGTRIFHALSEPGAAGPGAAQQAVDSAVRALNPGAVIAVGIAFGIDEEKQRIGDILLSKQLRLYDLQRVGSEVILRGDRPHAVEIIDELIAS